MASANVISADEIHKQQLGPEDFCCLIDIPEGTEIADSEFQRMLNAPPIIMHGGIFFGIRPTRFENAYTKRSLAIHAAPIQKDGVEHYPQADIEVRALAAAYRFHGHPVTFMLPQPGSVDGIFCTDSDKTFQAAKPVTNGSIKKWKFGKVVSLLPIFTHQPRQIEVPWKERLLKTTLQNPNPSAHRAILQMHHPLEFGDTRVSFHKTAGMKSGFVMAGIAETNEVAMGRSSIEGHEEMRKYLKLHVDAGLEVVTIHLRQPFYHMDTSGPTCTGGHMFTNRAAYTEESWDTLKQIFGEKLVELPLEDIGPAFGGNATCFGTNVYMSDAVSEHTIKTVTGRGYDLILTPVPYTTKGGGAHRCMTSVNPHYYIPGGYGESFNESRQGLVKQVRVDYQTGRITLSDRLSANKYANEIEIHQLVTEFPDLKFGELSTS